MDAKTSQLQIRVTEDEKAALKRLARAANMTVSAFVLAQALPTQRREVARLLDELPAASGRQREVLAALCARVAALPPADFAGALAEPPLESLSPILRNQIAAIVEQAAHAKAVEPPEWVGGVPPLARPHFAWPLSSLRPHQIRVTPAPFKRRGIFFDPASPRATPQSAPSSARTLLETGSEPLRRLALLNDALDRQELKVEFYFLGGALLFVAFHARPRTAHVSALFQPPGAVAETIASLTGREAWPTDWLPAAIREYLVGGVRTDRYLELANLSVFVPPIEYVLALEVASLRMGAGAGALDDLRYVLRALNVTEPRDAIAITGRYFGMRQIPENAYPILASLLTV
jgi:uncharacterized protein (DUF1778 family)